MTSIRNLTRVPNIIFEKCGYFLPRLMFLNSTHAAQIHWGDIAITLNNFPEDCVDISSKEFWDIWMKKWENTADAYYSYANETQLEQSRKRMLRSAAACYHWAEFMYFSDPSIKTELRIKAKACFQNSLDHKKLNIISGAIKFKDINMPYYLLMPDNVTDQKVPCVILSNGLDSMTEVEIFSFAEQFLSIGCAAFLFDGPGQGINLGVNPLQLKLEIIVDEIIKFLLEESRINIDKLIFFGVSFGGYLALRIAKFLGDKFKCIINLSGGPSLSNFQTLPRRLKEDFKYAFMEQNDNKMATLFDEIYLDMTGNYSADILSVHGKFDDIFPLEAIMEMDINLKNKHTLITYDSESHVCLNYINIYFIKILDWVAEKLQKSTN